MSATLQAAVANQGGLAQLMADLVQAQQTSGLPAPVQAAIVEVLAFRSPIDADLTAAHVKNALTNSGLFSEANAAEGLRTITTGTQARLGETDIKTALLVLQQALKNWLSGAPAPAKDAMPYPSRSPASSLPPPPYRGGPSSGSESPVAPMATAAVVQAIDPGAVARTTQARTLRPDAQISSSEAIMGVPPEFTMAGAVANMLHSAMAPSGPQGLLVPTGLPPIQLGVKTKLPENLALPDGATAKDDAPPEQPRSSSITDPASYRAPTGIQPDVGSRSNAPALQVSNPELVPKAAQSGAVQPQEQTPPTSPSNAPLLQVSNPELAPKASQSGAVQPQEQTPPAPPSEAMLEVPRQGEPDGGAPLSAATSTGALALPVETDIKTAILLLQRVLMTSLTIAPTQPYALVAAEKDAAPKLLRSPTNGAPPPPYRGGPTSAQRSLPPSLPAGADPRLVGEVLTKHTDAALSHIKLLQIASLPDAPQSTSANQNHVSRCMFEIPFATPEGSMVAQFQISRDPAGGGADQSGQVWRARFSLDVESMGPVHAEVALMGERAWVTLWAEREASMQTLRAQEALLSQSLKDSDVVAEITFCLGAPRRPVATTGQFLDSAS